MATTEPEVTVRPSTSPAPPYCNFTQCLESATIIIRLDTVGGGLELKVCPRHAELIGDRIDEALRTATESRK